MSYQTASNAMSTKPKPLDKRITFRFIAWNAVLLVILTTLFVPYAHASYFIIPIDAIVFICLLGDLKSNKSSGRITPLGLLVFGIWLFASIAMFLTSVYEITNAAKLSLYLICAILAFWLMELQNDEFDSNWFYWVFTICIAVTFAIYLINPAYYSSFANTYRPLDDVYPLFYGAADKNRTAVCLFLYLVMSLKLRKKFGIFLCVAYPLLYLGRQYISLCILFAALYLLTVRGGQGHGKRLVNTNAINARFVFIAFIASTLMTVFLSWFWVNYVIPMGTGADKIALNDHSNAIRFESIWFWWNEVVNNLGRYLAFGYDQDIFTVFGIDLSDTRKGATYYIADTYRLVQPHLEVLNTLVKEGIPFTAAYYIIVSALMSKLSGGIFNNCIIFSYMFGSMFLHEMFTMQFLLFLVLVLAISPKPAATKLSAKSNPLSDGDDYLDRRRIV